MRHFFLLKKKVERERESYFCHTIFLSFKMDRYSFNHLSLSMSFLLVSFVFYTWNTFFCIRDSSSLVFAVGSSTSITHIFVVASLTMLPAILSSSSWTSLLYYHATMTKRMVLPISRTKLSSQHFSKWVIRHNISLSQQHTFLFLSCHTCFLWQFVIILQDLLVSQSSSLSFQLFAYLYWIAKWRVFPRRTIFSKRMSDPSV